MNAWQHELEGAQQISEVIRITRDYLATLTLEELSSLSERSRPGRIRDASDIDFWNVRLADECRSSWGTPEDHHVLYELANYFLSASVRLSRLHEQSAAHQ